MKISVIGAGSWGSALAQLIAGNGHDVSLWALEPEVANSINSEHKNCLYLSDAILDSKISATNSLKESVEGVDAVCFVTPSQFLRSTAEQVKDFVGSDMPIVTCSKGTEKSTGFAGNEILADVLGNNERIAVLSGPTHAEEVIKNVPSAATCASTDIKTAEFFQYIFSCNSFRVYTSTDIIGVELCASFKNVIAIAVGISYGLGFGDNTAALIITRGMAEMSRVVTACGGQQVTCMGLAGAGDMVVTCMSRHSRNRRFGQDYIAVGKNLDDFKADTKMVVEGAVAAKNLRTLAERFSVSIPITDAVYDIIYNDALATDFRETLFNRPLKVEFE